MAVARRLPHATGVRQEPDGIIPGKLKGAMMAQTPSGWRIIVFVDAAARMSS
jgi:hypothetical protein